MGYYYNCILCYLDACVVVDIIYLAWQPRSGKNIKKKIRASEGNEQPSVYCEKYNT